MRALVLSGGGNRIFQIYGSAKMLWNSRGAPYKCFVGTSSGAILAMAIPSIGMMETRNLLWGIRGSRDVYRGNGGLFGKIGLAIGAKHALYNPSPLLKMLRANWHPKKVQAKGYQVAVRAVGLRSGKARTFPGIPSNPDFPRQVVASSSVLPFFPAVATVDDFYADGGLADFAPIGVAIKMGATDIDVVWSKPLQPAPWLGNPRGLGASFRQIDLLGHEVATGDLLEAARRNDHPGPGDKRIKVRVIAPTPGDFRALPSTKSYLDFDPSTYNKMEEIGEGAKIMSLEAAIEMARG